MKKESNCIVLLSHDGINSASAGVATYMQTYINAFHKILMEANHGSNREKISNIDSEEFLQHSNR